MRWLCYVMCKCNPPRIAQQGSSAAVLQYCSTAVTRHVQHLLLSSGSAKLDNDQNFVNIFLYFPWYRFIDINNNHFLSG